MLDQFGSVAGRQICNDNRLARDDTPAIRVAGVGKAYKSYVKPFDLLREVATGVPRHQEHWVLKDISFEISKGDIVGIIGANGAGKSTLLKIVAGLLDATFGTVEVKGRISAILELGTGFHPDFTGRQNIITGGMCLGMSRAEIEERQKWIIEFSELASVIDNPFRTYSSGMQARLTFATAVSVDPEIFIVDEALAAGDAYFVSKCIKRINEICSSGATVLFVSHSTNMVAQMCKSAIWLQDGRMHSIGPARDVAKQYDYAVHVRTSANAGQVVELPAEPLAIEAALIASEITPPVVPGMVQRGHHDASAPPAEAVTPVEIEPIDPTPMLAGNAAAVQAEPTLVAAPAIMKVYRKGPVFIDSVKFCDGEGIARSVFRTWDPLHIDVTYSCDGEIPEPTLGLAIGIERENDLVLIAQFSTVLAAGNEVISYDDAPYRRCAGRKGIISAVFPSLQMMNGDYLISVGVLPNVPGTVDFYEYRHRTYKMRVIAAGYPSGAAFYPLVEWQHTTTRSPHSVR